ncbi:hypothetical protein SDC9_132965 [bioreactor metagenome]|uniref:Uncharacterized protein n=1 Tax=bioreactor metagenome TaxID=1076179 RepID=A0A645DBD4_9ZZZZ
MQFASAFQRALDHLVVVVDGRFGGYGQWEVLEKQTANHTCEQVSCAVIVAGKMFREGILRFRFVLADADGPYFFHFEGDPRQDDALRIQHPQISQ